MKIKYLGTSAHEGLPAPFCKCPTCQRARLLGERNFRSRSQALVDDKILIDFNADTFMHFMRYKTDTLKIRYCLITHTHGDHFYLDDMSIARYAVDPEPLHFYAGQDGYDKAKSSFAALENFRNKYTLTKVSAYERFGIEDYEVLPVKATHDPKTSPLNYAFARGGKRMLYAHDTGNFSDETVSALRDFGKLDFVSMDCAGGLLDTTWGWHMTFGQVKTQLEILWKNGVVGDGTIVCLSHFAHISDATYDDMVNACRGTDILVAYDGMEIEF